MCPSSLPPVPRRTEVAPSSGRLPCSGQGTAAPRARCCGIRWVSPRGPGMGLPPASASGLLLFSGKLAAAHPLPARPAGWVGGLAQRAPRRATWASPPGPQGWAAWGLPASPRTWQIPGCEAQLVGRGGFPSVGTGQSPERLGHDPGSAQPGGCWMRGGMLAGARGEAQCLGAEPALNGVQLCRQPPARLAALGWACRGLGLSG